jgi:diacylglycerol kinase family enzyme
VWLVPSARVDPAVEEALAASCDAVIVGGGDGTISRCLQAVVGSPKMFGILPLGTVNLLGRDINLPNNLASAIEGLCRAEPGAIDLATVNDRPFHSISGLGFFGRMAREREKARRLGLPRWIAFGKAALRAICKRGVVRLAITTHAETRIVDASAVLVTNNRFHGEGWRRHRLDEGLLEVHLLGAHGMGHRLRAGFDVLRGRWHDNETIETIAADFVEVLSRRPRLWVATDGELSREQAPLRYGVRCKALTLLIPRSPGNGEAHHAWHDRCRDTHRNRSVKAGVAQGRPSPVSQSSKWQRSATI